MEVDVPSINEPMETNDETQEDQKNNQKDDNKKAEEKVNLIHEFRIDFKSYFQQFSISGFRPENRKAKEREAQQMGQLLPKRRNCPRNYSRCRHYNPRQRRPSHRGIHIHQRRRR